MSIRYITAAFDAVVGDPITKLVLVKLADNTNDKGQCWPSLETIAKETELSRRTVIRHVERLEEMGVLKKTKRYDDTGSPTSNFYSLSLRILRDLTPSDTESLPSDTESPYQCQTVTTPSVTVSPKPSIEPSIEPEREEPTKIALNPPVSHTPAPKEEAKANATTITTKPALPEPSRRSRFMAGNKLWEDFRAELTTEQQRAMVKIRDESSRGKDFYGWLEFQLLPAIKATGRPAAEVLGAGIEAFYSASDVKLYAHADMVKAIKAILPDKKKVEAETDYGLDPWYLRMVAEQEAAENARG